MKKNISIVVLSFTLLGVSCDDVLEKDISHEQVVLITPADLHTTSAGVQNFWWDEVKGARHYRLRIATPDFTNPSEQKLDTLIQKNSFTMEIPAGNYEWCVRAENGGYQTGYSCRNLVISE